MRIIKAHVSGRLQLAGIGNFFGVDHVTDHTDQAPQTPSQTQQSLSGLLDHPDLLRVRILPAQFARAVGVSKQSTTRWVRDGWVTLGADGRLDPTVAIGQLLRRCDPGRLRARWLRQAVTEVQELREAAAMADERVAAVEARAEDRAGIAEAALREALAQIAHLERWTADGDAHADTFFALLVEHAETLRATPPEAWAQTLSDLSNAAWDVVDPATGAIHEPDGRGGD